MGERKEHCCYWHKIYFQNFIICDTIWTCTIYSSYTLGQSGASRNVYDGSRYMYDRNTARESRRDSDNVAIHTIQADDNESRMHEISAVPKLNLQQMDNR